jgi:hypothetical protein
MYMEDGLSGIGSGVCYDPIAPLFSNSFLLRDLDASLNKIAKDFGIGAFEFGN